MSNLVHEPAVGAIVLNARDVTEQKALEAELRHQAFHDPLTSLANRALFRDRLEHTLTRRAAGDVFVLYLDIDRFKDINDTLGHSQGDVLLVEVAERLKRCVRAEDTIARLGGDEFAILLERASLEDASTVAIRIREAMEEGFVSVSEAIEVRASIGIAACDDHAPDAETLLRNADLAMYEAKSHRLGHVVYHPTMHDELVERMTLAADLRIALERDELMLRYQPTIALEDGRMEGVEALIRWQHPRRGELPPGVFIPVAERAGLIGDVGRWVLRTACAQAAEWRRLAPDRPIVMNVNVTASELLEPDFVESVLATLRATGLPARQLVLELTENSLVEQTDRCCAALEELRRHGIRIAIDDFGTGYSSLSYVQRLPVDLLKIDRSFIEKIASLGRDGEIVNTIVALAQTLGLTTVAEGIETAAQLRALEDIGCDLGQGFLFARPLSADQIAELLRSSNVLVASGG